MLLEQHSATAGSIRQVGIALKLSDTPGRVRQLAPTLGQHTTEVLTALGYTEQDIARLRQTGSVA
jgi:formyl-CoA transferase